MKIVLGIVPFKLHDVRLRKDRFVNNATSEGIVPKIYLLLRKISFCNVVKSPISDGMVPWTVS